MSLYLLLILASFAGPFLLSFDKKVAFYKSFKYLFPAIFIVALIFIIWDIYFTQHGIWGFNEQYLQGIFIGNLPLEECLFFLIIPFCCLFVYEVFRIWFPNFTSIVYTKIFAYSFMVLGAAFALLNYENWYTLSACASASLLTIIIFFILKVSWYKHFAIAFLICQVPFLIVNGILTGSLTNKPVVWYSENHIMGPRIFTIPLEDVFYNYAMLLPIIFLFEKFRQKKSL